MHRDDTTVQTKTCTKCRKTLPVTQFYRSSRNRDGLDGWCKACKKAIDWRPLRQIVEVCCPHCERTFKHHLGKKQVRSVLTLEEIGRREDGAAVIRLADDAFALVDWEDVPLVVGRAWRFDRTNWRVYTRSTEGRTLFMHRLVMGAETGEIIDHRNGNRLDNRRSVNLRRCSHAENSRNMKMDVRNTSGYKGVVKTPGARWLAKIQVNGKSKAIGRFDSPEDAARAYDDAARFYHQEFATLNFPRFGEVGVDRSTP